ncbi:MAG: copper amine oxidase N-terminal domain-containing protein [Candidatus Cohnella colombiensis]|uniref:Copper amine oxidase N-terminal domain-containing protein n=1 Tax=Candidatus Cohnella colombiensis TaxID=3121368 RepID=A0AA95EYB7_9BACL|nr:MAG: copper amine oxidase N-terminal domain-containing protein [Cohnella sp.]
MKKYMFLMLVVLLFLSTMPLSVSAQSLYKENEVLLKLNNGYVLYSDQTMPYVDKNNRTLIPLRMIGDLLGAEVKWDDKKKEAEVGYNKVKVNFTEGKKYFSKNGETVKMDTSVTIKDGTIMIPLRYIAEAFEMTLHWDKINRVVELIHPNLLSTKAFSHFDEMENRDDTFEGQFIPVKVEFVKGKTSDENKLLVSVRNTSTTTIEAEHMHRNARFYSDPNTEMGIDTHGYTASSGLTGINEQDIPAGAVFVDTVSMKSLDTSFDKHIKYLIFNYFNTKQ